ncbi:MAG: signal peptidase I [Bacteroidota bacterium]|nr:signal peptidase I [Bacteroidota bacterium]MDP4218281.1 signal peptidase I [Bacteroidota bacterium]MDP4253617.1 signal peptidase I [Bacteroidota bacterium]MDP4258281.1 signal peptidase I [Bacteroidota bacterium]
MSIHQILVLLLIQLLILMLPSPGIYKMFQKAGFSGFAGAAGAFIPFYNTWIMQKLEDRPRHWVYWQIIPVVGWFISMGIFVEFAKVFGKFRFHQHALAALLPVIYFPYIGNNKKDKYIGPERVKKHKKSTAREWVDAAIFAVIAATLIRTFVFEAYTIPSGSMEKTLLVGDFLFVSKFSYGPRIPNTPLSVPFVHNTMPITNGKSYLEWIKLPYIRWFPAKVNRGDVVVFNFPAGDTLIDLPDYGSKDYYYQVCRRLGNGNQEAGRQIIMNDPDQYPLIVYPVDKQENYIKRCVAVSGDTLQIRDQVVYINGKVSPLPPESETDYIVTTGGQPLDETVMKEEYNLDINDSIEFQALNTPNTYRMLLTAQARTKMTASGLAKSITPMIDHVEGVFPYDRRYPWTQDNFGPLWIPRKGVTLTLTAENYPKYERAIRVYEGNTLENRDGKFFINGEETNQYTFKMDYYWMMGDNRHESQDSRFWGFVPEDHVVGGAWRIWMSWDHGVRWRRLFKKIQ